MYYKIKLFKMDIDKVMENITVESDLEDSASKVETKSNYMSKKIIQVNKVQ